MAQPSPTTDTSARTTLTEHLHGQRIALMTTVEDDGSLHSRPMTLLEVDADGCCWFFLDHDPQDATTVARHARISLAFADPSRADYLSVSGRGTLVHDRERIHALWTAMAKPWFPDGPDSPRLAALRVAPERAEVWDGPDSKIVRSLALAASVTAGRPIGLGHHEVLLDAGNPVSR